MIGGLTPSLKGNPRHLQISFLSGFVSVNQFVENSTDFPKVGGAPFMVIFEL
jgi:hypothetical protein